MTSKTSGEGEIRKAMLEAGLMDCIVNLPAKLFLNTQIPAALWFMSVTSIGEISNFLLQDMENILNFKMDFNITK